MKTLITLIFALWASFVLTACGSSSDKPGSDHGLIDSTDTRTRTPEGATGGSSPEAESNTTAEDPQTGGSTQSDPDTPSKTQPASDENTGTAPGSGGQNTNGSTADRNNSSSGNTALKTLTLSVDAASLNKDHNTTLKAEALYTDNSTKDLTTRVQWIVTPPDAVKISGHTLTALKDVNVTIQAKAGSKTSNPVTLSIYWEVNGHRLPPEPDPKVNNATLLGVDVNRNGVRDDVERYIIIEEAKNKEFPKTQTEISLQYAWAWQKMIEKPTIDSRKYLENASACQEYFVDSHTKNMSYHEYRKWGKKHLGRLGIKLEDKIFNTKERILQRFKFNQACNGHIFDLKEAKLDACRTNIDRLGE